MAETKTAPASAVTPAELARRVAARLRRHPEPWDQATWLHCDEHGPLCHYVFDVWLHIDDLMNEDGHCDTTACVAGHTVAEALAAGVSVNEYDHIRDAAAELLGLGPVAEDRLPAMFKENATLEDVLQALDDIASRRMTPNHQRRAGRHDHAD